MTELKDYQSELSAKAARVEALFKKYPDQTVGLEKTFVEINELKIKTVEPQIMVYGIYNAGKSSILNELMGEDKAKVNDVPETDRVTYYDWQGYKIADTPGVFAPIEHETVTEEHLRKADVVLFVMSTTGSNEKLENYARMKAIADAGKKIIIVLNDKNGDMGKNDASINLIKRQVAVNMQRVGIEDVDNKYCIVTVNAKRANTGRLKGKPALIEKSGMVELKDVILSELKRTSSFDILRNGIKQIEGILDQFIDMLEGQDDSELVQKMSHVLETFSRQKLGMRRQINLFIDMQADRLGETLPQLIWENRSNQTELDGLIAREVGKLNQAVQNEISERLKEIALTLEMEIKSFAEIKFEAQSVDAESFKTILNKLAATTPNAESLNASKAPSKAVDGEALIGTVGAIGATSVATGGLVSTGAKALAGEFVKTELGAALAKTTLGKIAGSLLPIVGPVVTVVSAISMLSNLFGGGDDREQMEAQNAARNEEARRRMEAEMQARQELNQKCRYMADKLADELKATTSRNVEEVLASYEEPFKEEIARRKDSGSHAADDAIELRAIKDEYDQLLRNELRAR